MWRFPANSELLGLVAARAPNYFLLLFAFLTPIVAGGQTQNPADTSSLRGYVRDSASRMVAGATVYLHLKDDQQTLSARTDPTGSYHFSGLREGIYILRVEINGFSPATFGPCVVASGQAKSFDLTVEPSKQIPSQPASSEKKNDGKPEFFDEPQFTVAGVTDGTNLGGHGSNTVVRAKESLAKDVASLSVSEDKLPSNSMPIPGSSTDSREMSLRAEVNRQPGSFDANHRLGQLLLHDGQPSEALVYLERSAQLNPADYENSYLLALAYADAGQNQNARTRAQALLTSAPKKQKEQADLHHLLGDVEERSGNPLEAVREYQRAAELDPTESNFFDWGAELLLHRAVEPAIEVFRQGHRLFPHSARMLVALGVASYSNGSYDQAAQRLCEASDLNPSDPKAYLFLGKIQAVETTPSECSTERLTRFVKLQPESALAHYFYGVNLWKRRKGPDDGETLALAEIQLKKAVQLDSTLGVSYLQLGILYSEKRDFAAAVSAFQEATKASPQLEEAHYRLSQAYKRTGDKLKADEELQLYNQISKKKDEEVERERRESRQFVYTLRSPEPGSQPQ
jgi:tetratricopeptide (TPR) repeat protein